MDLEVNIFRSVEVSGFGTEHISKRVDLEVKILPSEKILKEW